MTQLTVLAGPPAFSSFRLQGLKAQLPGCDNLQAEFVHLILSERTLTDTEHRIAAELLRYGPGSSGPSGTAAVSSPGERRPPTVTAVPRAGSISPWSSKATDIFHTCDLGSVLRVERGRALVLWTGMRTSPMWTPRCRRFTTA